MGLRNPPATRVAGRFPVSSLQDLVSAVSNDPSTEASVRIRECSKGGEGSARVSRVCEGLEKHRGTTTRRREGVDMAQGGNTRHRGTARQKYVVGAKNPEPWISAIEWTTSKSDWEHAKPCRFTMRCHSTLQDARRF